ncbi:MAG: AraC family transcriptional regulator [Chthoniobacteraceae bacterium]
MRVTDWASLNASLVWAYNGTYYVGGGDGMTEPTQIAVWLVRKGSAKIVTRSGSISAREGEWLLPGRAPRRQFFSPDARLLSVNFTATWPDGRWLFPGSAAEVFSAAINPRLTRESVRLVNYVTAKFGAKGTSLRDRPLGLTNFLDLERQFFGWLGSLVRTAEKAGLEIAVPPSADTRVTEALRFLQRWPMEKPFREALLSRSTGLSSIHLNRLFLKNVGMSPRAYFERCRLERAIALLRDPTRSIKQVAAGLGFSSHSYFSAWFQRLRNSSPTNYRANLTI